MDDFDPTTPSAQAVNVAAFSESTVRQPTMQVLADQVREAERAIAELRDSTAPQIAALHDAEHELQRRRRRMGAARLRAWGTSARRTARRTARIVLALYGTYAIFYAVLLLLQGRPSAEMFIAAASGFSTAVAIPKR